MKKLILVASVAALALTACNSRADEEAAAPAAAAASADISGEWFVDPADVSFENDVDSYLLQDGTITCESCIPPYSYAANGEMQQVDRPGLDQIMMEVVDANTVRSAGMFDGEETGSSTWTVSEDGSAMTIEWTNLRGDVPVSGTTNFNRVGDAPEGAHAVSGGWEVAGVSEMTAEGRTFSIAIEGDQYVASGNGDGWTATIGGDPVAIEGNDAGEMVQIEAIDGGYRETYTRDGEVVDVTEISKDADGNLVGTNTDPRDGRVVRWKATPAS